MKRGFHFLGSTFALLVCISAGADVRRAIFKHQWFDRGGGTRWLKIEALRDDVLHVETFEGPQGPKGDAIWVSPMVDRANYDNGKYSGPRFWRTDERTFAETEALHLTVHSETRCLQVYDKIRKNLLTDLCSEKLNDNIKTLRIEKKGMTDVYGVGNLFNHAESADGNWIGRDWNARGAGNFRFGLDFNDDFAHGGGPSVSQFPMIFVTGDVAPENGFRNYGLFLDQTYKVSANFKEDFTELKKRPDGTEEQVKVWTTSMGGAYSGEPLRFFLFGGGNLKDIRKNYMELVGYPMVPPKSTLGHWTAKFGYRNWKDLIWDVESLRKNDFPLDGAALDIFWFDGSFGQPSSHRMGSLSFQEKEKDGSPKFNDPYREITRLQEEYGIRLMTIEESYIDSQLGDFKALADANFRLSNPDFAKAADPNDRSVYLMQNWRQGKLQPLYVTTNYHFAGDDHTEVWWGTGSMVDWPNPGARKYWHQLKRQPLAAMGILDFWLDLGEPEMFYERAVSYGFPEVGKTDHEAIHNNYNRFWAQGIREGMENPANAPELKAMLKRLYKKDFNYPPRFWSMSRAGTVGSHRYGGMWSGDVASNVENLRGHLQTQTNMSLLGVDFYSSDTGGFFHQGRPPEDPMDKEVVTKWAATSSLLDNPIRPHGWALDGSTYRLDARGNLDSNRANIRRKYELIPYVYSLAHRAHREGEPMYPPLVYHYQGDKNKVGNTRVREMGNVKLIGEALLFGVSATENETERRVYLPAGDWVDYENERWYSGGSETAAIGMKRTERVPEAELKEDPKRNYFMIPLFVKSGSIIPKMYVDQHTMNVFGRRDKDPRKEIHDELILRVVRGDRESQFTLYEDDGLSTGYLHNELRTTVLKQVPEDDGGSVVVEASRGSFTDAPIDRALILEYVSKGREAGQVVLKVGHESFDCGRVARIPGFAKRAEDVAQFNQAVQKMKTSGTACWYHSQAGYTRAGSLNRLPIENEKRFTVQFAN